MFALFETHTELLPFSSKLSLTRPLTLEFNLDGTLTQIHFSAKYTKSFHAVAKTAYFAAFALRRIS